MRLFRKGIAAVAALAAFAGVLTAEAKENFKLATLGPGSSPYLVMSTFAQMVNRQLPDVEIQVNATGAATQHALDAGSGKLDFFMWSASVHDFMTKGAAMYKNIPQAPELSKNLRAVFAFPLGLYHIVTWADSGIETLHDIKGKTVFLGPPGGGATTIMQNVIEGATGLETNKDFDYVKVGWDAAAQAFQDGRIDVYINPTNAPSPVIEQFALTRKIRLIGLTDEQMQKPEVAKILERPGGTLGVIEAGTYGDNQVNTEAVQTLGSTVGIGIGKHVSEEAAYEITKAFWTAWKSEQESTPWLRKVTLEGAFTDLNLPLHPGAARYYKEIGLTIPEAIAPTE